MDHVALFGEDQARYVVTCPAAEAAKIITQAHVEGVDVIRIGTVTADAVIDCRGRCLYIAGGACALPMKAGFPAYMAGEV